jgi:hypothetical protein
MFEKHTTKTKTGQQYEKYSGGWYYRIYEIENGRYIDSTKYVPYLEWSGTPVVVNITPISPTSEQKWNTIRSQRTEMLRACDWTQLSDVPLTDDEKASWQKYRQSLRDITLQTDPDNIIWPISPT